MKKNLSSAFPTRSDTNRAVQQQKMAGGSRFRIQHYANMSVQYTAIFHGCKNDNFQMKNFDSFLIFAQNIDCGNTLEPPQRDGSNEYPQSMFWSKNKKKYVYPSKPHFFYIKVG